MIKVQGQGIVVGNPLVLPSEKEGDILVRYNKRELITLYSDTFKIILGIESLRSGDKIKFSGTLEKLSLDNIGIRLTYISKL